MSGITSSGPIVIYESAFIISSLEDYLVAAPLVGGKHEIQPNIAYIMDVDPMTPYETQPPATGNMVIIGNGTGASSFTYIGGGTMFTQTAKLAGAYSFWDILLKGNGTAKFTDVVGDGEVFFTRCEVAEMDDLGILNIGSFSEEFLSILDFNLPWDITYSADCFIESTIVGPNGATDCFVLHPGPNSKLQVVMNTPDLPTDAFLLNIPATANAFKAVVFGNVRGDTGNTFNPAGLNHTDPRIDAALNPGDPSSETIGSFYMPETAGTTPLIRQGNDTAILGFADSITEPGVKTTVTTAAGNTVVLNDIEVIQGGTSYDGTHVASNIGVNQFDIPVVFIPDTGAETGTLEEGWAKIAGTTVEDEAERCTMTDNNELTFANLATARGKAIATIYAQTSGGAGLQHNIALFKNGQINLASRVNRELTNKISNSVSVGSVSFVTPDVFEYRIRNMASLVLPNVAGLSTVID